MPSSTLEAPYTGPSVPHLLANHLLAQNIILYHAHPTSSAILDSSELALLHRFVANPTPETRATILAEKGIEDEIPKGETSLVTYVIFEHEPERKNLLDGGEIEMLRVWFEGLGMEFEE
ncbi:hypothetical protein T440DRAFT_466443 [Plenodomus tracheiphilus IPT5]|uniref:Uncharacterized protein n=1 Tax=Plenodomus tracheiphilus IPT5 TaxID=1408161 RepID=A0A6A7BBH1_9PLEO|nr:hypothetical protein T440DRAFT_466443 [Plenodomus tracheiphilus IPT5]